MSFRLISFCGWGNGMKFIFTFAVLSVVTAILVSPVYAASPAQCEKLAGMPADPESDFSGVLFNKINAPTAISVCREALKTNPDQANIQFWLGRSLAKAGQDEEAIVWLMKASNAGYVAAHLNLGFSYANGLGVPKNMETAFALYEKSSIIPSAKVTLGQMHQYGIGTQKNLAIAVKWYEKAAAQSYGHASYILSGLYEHGIHYPQNNLKQLVYLKRAAEQGYAIAQTKIGTVYFEGKRLPLDKKFGCDWFEKAAAQQDARGEFNYGNCFVLGEGRDMDIQKGIEYLSRSANQGNEQAVEYLGMIMAMGPL